ncbi:hypothetical protein LCGC14_0494960 [marine sediment metagenome]|uniref:DUF5658 domain-containing protein n=1 Tax=marine sediment metagenome TaxID=412755 RepID=A0A0F9SAI9_9ZZZZ
MDYLLIYIFGIIYSLVFWAYGDIKTTKIAMSIGLEESNPLARSLVNNGHWKIITTLKILPCLVPIGNIMFGFLGSIIVFNNYNIITKKLLRG